MNWQSSSRLTGRASTPVLEQGEVQHIPAGKVWDGLQPSAVPQPSMRAGPKLASNCRQHPVRLEEALCEPLDALGPVVLKLSLYS